MDAIPFIVLLVPYFFVVVVAAIFLFFNVFHLWRYGVEGAGSVLLIAFYIGLFALTVGGSWAALHGFAWNDTFSLKDLFPDISFSSSPGL